MSLAPWPERCRAALDGEPLEVTPAEFAALRRALADWDAAHPETWLPAAEVGSFAGVPVVVVDTP